MTDSSAPNPSSPFVQAWIDRLAPEPGRRTAALDVACGAGRHLLPLAEAGFTVYGVDRDLQALSGARAMLRARGHRGHLWCADLTRTAPPAGTFNLVIVTRYLQRDLLPAIEAALAPDGVLLYETFTELQLRHPRGPRSPEYLLRPGELARGFPALRPLFYEEVEAPDAVARLAAQRR